MTSSSASPNFSTALPLAGKTVLVTRSAGQSNQFTTLLRHQGATVIEMPTLEIVPPSSWEPLDQAIAQLQTYQWLILTSSNGVDYFFERLQGQDDLAEALNSLKIAVVGQKTAASLRRHGREPDFIPPDFVADSLVEHFPEGDRLAGMKILFPRVETGGREVLVKELTARGAEVVEVPAYQSDCARAIDPAVLAAFQQNAIDIVTFASSKTVRCFCQLFGQSLPRQPLSEQPQPSEMPLPPGSLPKFALPDSICIASIGPQTSATCKELLGRFDLEAKDYTLEGLTQAIVAWVLARNMED